MPVKVFCPNPSCDASYGVDESVLGSHVRCKKCGAKFVAGEEPPAPPTSSGTSLPDTTLEIPNPFGKYRVIKRLGRGGMGAVYLAYDDDLDRPVALKIPNTSSVYEAEILERFKREAKAAASFHHPNFCPVYEAGKVGDRPYLAMAYVEGKELSSLVSRDRPMDPREAARLISKIALAMAEAHDKGVIHRDLKPSNVMIDKKGEPIIMDFGLARRDGSKDAELTASNAMLGTIYYMSPEQVRGEKASISSATDIYSLGVILYELMTGRRPFEGPPTSVIAFILMNEPPSASNHQPGLDGALVAACHRAMSKAIPDRFASMRAFASALDECLSPPALPPIETSESESPSRTPKPGFVPPPFDLRLILATLAGIVAVVLGVIVYVATDKGTLKIEGSEPGMVVRIDGQVTTIENVGKPITVRTGEHGLFIKRGDVVAKAPEVFEIKRGRETVVRIEFAPKILAKSPLPTEPVEKKSEPARPPDKPANPAPVQSVEMKKDAAKPKEPTSFAGRQAGELKTIKVDTIDVVLCWCPPGTFTMGSPTTESKRDAYRKDEDQVNVTITKGFWMMKTEMTQELYEAVMGKNPSDFKGPKLPVETVNYDEAVECAAKLTKKLRESQLLPDGWEIRLPTEAQWEYAARAGTKTATPFGDMLSSTEANFDGRLPYGGAAKGLFLKKTREVGSYKPNAWGLCDTVGNVREWTLDAYETKLPGGVDPFVAGVGVTNRVFRGGCWLLDGQWCRSAERDGHWPRDRFSSLGFRLAAVQSVP